MFVLLFLTKSFLVHTDYTDFVRFSKTFSANTFSVLLVCKAFRWSCIRAFVPLLCCKFMHGSLHAFFCCCSCRATLSKRYDALPACFCCKFSYFNLFLKSEFCSIPHLINLSVCLLLYSVLKTMKVNENCFLWFVDPLLNVSLVGFLI